MSYDAPGVPIDWSEGEAVFFVFSAFNFGLLAAVPLPTIDLMRSPYVAAFCTDRWVLVFTCGCARVIDRRGDYHEYPHVWVHTHFVDRG